jgi:hypothetical protein
MSTAASDSGERVQSRVPVVPGEEVVTRWVHGRFVRSMTPWSLTASFGWLAGSPNRRQRSVARAAGGGRCRCASKPCGASAPGAGRGQERAAMAAWAARTACASGQPSRMRTTSRRAWRMRRAGACQSRQRRDLGSARASRPWRQRSWNQRTRSPAKQTVASQDRCTSGRARRQRDPDAARARAVAGRKAATGSPLPALRPRPQSAPET